MEHAGPVERPPAPHADSCVYFWREVWRPALELAELAYRPPYNVRHTYAYWSLQVGVPIATVAREMGADAA